MSDISHLLNKIHLGDCLEFMRELPDKCVDLVLTDPPYGIRADENPVRGIKKYHVCNFDRERPSAEYFDEMIRISKNQIIWGGELLCRLISCFSGVDILG